MIISMKNTDNEIEAMALDLSPKEHNAFPNHSDADIWVNGFIQGFKQCQEMSDWVSVEDRLPEYGVKVLGAFVCEQLNVYELVQEQYGTPPYPNYWQSVYGNEHFLDVTHWQTLPSPPQTK